MIRQGDIKKGEIFVLIEDFPYGFSGIIKKGTHLVFIEMNPADNCRFYLTNRKTLGYYDAVIHADVLKIYMEKLSDRRIRIAKEFMEC